MSAPADEPIPPGLRPPVEGEYRCDAACQHRLTVHAMSTLPDLPAGCQGTGWVPAAHPGADPEEGPHDTHGVEDSFPASDPPSY